uniref:Tubby C-terminal domain-containing protein n=1 Tax=Picea sitchensis TaxID=3332 RepID=B8LPH7_PICSI|nr:unknown [Picea sitchensis]
MTTNTDAIVRPVVSKQFCSTSKTAFLVRKRPCAVNGGGFVVTDCGGNEVFRVEGCGLMVKHQAVLKDGEGKPILTLKRKVGVVEVFSFHKQWQGFVRDEIDGVEKPIFKVTASTLSCSEKNPIKVSLTNSSNHRKRLEYEIVGSFTERACGIYADSNFIVAEVKMNDAITDVMGSIKDIYSVVVQPGVDQAFVFGLVAVLDKLNGEDS